MVAPWAVLLAFVVLSAAAWWTGAAVANVQADRREARPPYRPRGRG